MMKYRFSQHLPNQKNAAIHFFWLSALSVVAVFCIALLIRSELRLSGELLAAGDGSDLAILTEMGAYDDVVLLRETDDTKLYLLRGDQHSYIAHVVKVDGEWVVEKIEKAHQ